MPQLSALNTGATRKFATEPDTKMKIYQPPPQLAKDAYIKTFSEYEKLHAASLADPNKFWGQMADENIAFSTPYKTVRSGACAAETEWFAGGKLNASYNCVDRHAIATPNKVALIWESDDGQTVRTITYKQLHSEVQRVANVLKELGGSPKTMATLYMPMIPETAITMLACARIGMPHNVVFAGFSVEALRERITSSNSSIIVTADELLRAGKSLGLKRIIDTALEEGCPSIKKVLVVRHTGIATKMTTGRDVWYEEEITKVDPVCEPTPMDSEAPLFCLFTSGSTGKPKGLIHSTAGYLTYAAVTTKYAFDVKDTDVYACMADCGWITGHTYIVYGPLSLGATVFMFEGVPFHPHHGRYWELTQKHKLSIFYTSPTAVRALMRYGTEPVKSFDRSSIRIIGSVGEPIGPDAWEWLYREVGDNRCPIIDTYWQTESGGILLSPLPGVTPMKAGSCTFPFFGIETALLDPITHKELPAVPGESQTGALVVKQPWPGLARTVLGNHDRYLAGYFPSKEQPNSYVTGDSARRDADGYYWIVGRMDDVINVSGHRIGSAEVEGVLMKHPHIAEAAVVSMPHPIKGEALFAFVSLKVGEHGGDKLVSEARALVAHQIGKLALPDYVCVAEALPKTRSGKIMRRLLRQLVLGKTDAASLGDTSTLLDPAVVDVLAKQVGEMLQHGVLTPFPK